MSDFRIGGDVTSKKFAKIFAFGVMIGTLIRLGMWILPSKLVDAVIERL